MTKEELNEEWEILFTGPCSVLAWGKWMVNLHHISGCRVSGYGENEQEALNDAATLIQKPPLENKNEISH